MWEGRRCPWTLGLAFNVLIKSLSGWSVTGLRGQGPVLTTSVGEAPPLSLSQPLGPLGPSDLGGRWHTVLPPCLSYWKSVERGGKSFVAFECVFPL